MSAGSEKASAPKNGTVAEDAASEDAGQAWWVEFAGSQARLHEEADPEELGLWVRLRDGPLPGVSSAAYLTRRSTLLRVADPLSIIHL
jgi:hypothetical protein